MRSQEGAGGGCSLGRAPPTGPRAPRGSQRGGVRRHPAMPSTLSGALALDPKRVKRKLLRHPTRFGLGPRTQLTLGIRKARPSTGRVLTLQIPVTAWAQPLKPGGRQLRNMRAAGAACREWRGRGGAQPRQCRCARSASGAGIPFLLAFPLPASGPRTVLICGLACRGPTTQPRPQRSFLSFGL